MKRILASFLLGVAPAAAAQPLLLDAHDVGTREAHVSYVTGGDATILAQVSGMCPPGAKGIALTLRCRTPTQLRLYLIPAAGESRYRFVALGGGDSPRTLRLPIEAFDVDPQVERGRVDPGGALLILDVPGFLRGRLDNRLVLSECRVLDHRPPRPRQESPPDPYPHGEDHRRILGGWLGKCAGGRLGMPLEGSLLPDWQGIERRRLGFDGDPVRGFGPDDDTSLMVRHLLEFERYGEALTPEHLLRSWREGYSPEYLWKTERLALERHAAGTAAGECGRGPLGETLAARIRADLWGLLHPGDPVGALRLVEQDAVLSASGTGLDSALYFAAASSLAFRHTRVDDLLEAVSALPSLAGSPHAEMTRELRKRHQEKQDVQTVRGWIKTRYFDEIHRRDPGHAWAYALPNDALVILALLEGDGDFSRTVALAASLGWDTDCNAATAGCLLGIMGGHPVIPPRFRDALADRLRVAIPRREHWSLERLAALTASLARPRPPDDLRDPGHR